MAWAERSQVLPFPIATPQAKVDALSHRLSDVLRFVRADCHGQQNHMRMELSGKAQAMYAALYHDVLCKEMAGEAVSSLLERRAPMLLRLAMLFALTDLELHIGTHHLQAALAWIEHCTETVQYVFTSAAENATQMQLLMQAQRITAFLQQRSHATRSEITRECFGGHISKDQLDHALEHLLSAAPPRIAVACCARPVDRPGSSTRIYRMVHHDQADKG